MPGNVGWQGLLVILLVLLLIFGPKRLPEMGRSLGRGIRELRQSVTGEGGDEDEAERAKPEITRTSTTEGAGQREGERVSS